MEYFGLDVHKRYTVFTHVDASGRVLGQGRVQNDAASTGEAVSQKLRSRDGQPPAYGSAGQPPLAGVVAQWQQ